MGKTNPDLAKVRKVKVIDLKGKKLRKVRKTKLGLDDY